MRNENWFYLFLNQNICCGNSKEPSQWDGSFEHPKTYVKTDGYANIYNFALKMFVYLNLCTLYESCPSIHGIVGHHPYFRHILDADTCTCSNYGLHIFDIRCLHVLWKMASKKQNPPHTLLILSLRFCFFFCKMDDAWWLVNSDITGYAGYLAKHTHWFNVALCVICKRRNGFNMFCNLC